MTMVATRLPGNFSVTTTVSSMVKLRIGADAGREDFGRLCAEEIAHGVDGVRAHVGDGAGPESVARAVVLSADRLREAGVEVTKLAELAAANGVQCGQHAGFVVEAVSDHEFGAGGAPRLR